MNEINFNWEKFYNELAWKLLNYKNKRTELISIVKNCFLENNLSLPTLERGEIIDIDPFTIIGLFNRQIKDESRIKIAQSLKKHLGVDSDAPLSFDGVPILNNQNTTFYWFVGDRADNDINDLWDLFYYALNFSVNQNIGDKENFIKYFDLCLNKKGNGNSKITMALFWINPSFYLNLDSRNVWYIYESGKLPESFVKSLPEFKNNKKANGVTYLLIVEKLHEFIKSNNEFVNFKELSHEAWKYANEVNEQLKSSEADMNDTLTSIDNDGIRYWLYSPGSSSSSKWDLYSNNGLMGIGWGAIGDLTNYNSKNDMKKAMKELIDPKYTYTNAAHATWQFVNEMKPGDIIFVKNGLHKIVGRGVVESNYFFDETVGDGFKNLRKVRWTHIGEWEHPGQAAIKTLTDITRWPDYVNKLKQLFVDEEIVDDEEIEEELEVYNEALFLNDVFMNKSDYDILKSLISVKKNVILQGSPGVGKTYIAEKLAYSLLGKVDKDRIEFIQFHQSYCYEDFIEGFRPSKDNSFTLKKGIFYNFCMKALQDSENNYFFIIDEINRGNLSKIFGELFMLIEADKRNKELPLLYSGDKFKVPSNVYLIGLMNTADRSLAMLDYALRRRFAFFTIKPGFSSEGFKKYQSSLNNDKFNKLVEMIEMLNQEIANDESLGEGFEIGHSYFCNFKNETSNISNIIEFELIPLLKEYWFDDPSKVREWSNKLRGIL